jgi:hypothetical protein
MTVFQVTYRLSDPVQDYDELYERIGSLGDSVHEENMCWFVETDSSHTEVRDELKKAVSGNDHVFVMEANLPWASNFSNEVTDWLRDKMS